MAHGGARPNAGRKAGARNSLTTGVVEAMLSNGELTPLEYLKSVYQDASADEAKRIDCAKAAAPYVHAKLSAVQVGGDEDNPLEVVTRIELVDGNGKD